MVIHIHKTWITILQFFKAYTLPSLVSFWTSIILAILIVFAAGLYISFQSGTLLTALLGDNVSFRSALFLQNEVFQAFQQTSENQVINRLPVAILWGSFGLALYILIEFFVSTMRGISDIRKQLDYVNTDKKNFLKFTALRALLRITVLAFGVIFTTAFTKHIFTYIWLNLELGSYSLPALRSIPYFLLAFTVTVLCLHTVLVILRLLTLRPRLFSTYSFGQHH